MPGSSSGTDSSKGLPIILDWRGHSEFNIPYPSLCWIERGSLQICYQWGNDCVHCAESGDGYKKESKLQGLLVFFVRFTRQVHIVIHATDKVLVDSWQLANNNLTPRRTDHNYDKLYKIRPYINKIRKSFKNNYYPTQNTAIDESMVKFKGRSSLKQYMPKKPTKRGYKVWTKCASTGYCLDFDIYTGKVGDRVETDLGGKIVRKFCEDLEGKNQRVYFDNYFNSYFYKWIYGKNKYTPVELSMLLANIYHHQNRTISCTVANMIIVSVTIRWCATWNGRIRGVCIYWRTFMNQRMLLRLLEEKEMVMLLK